MLFTITQGRTGTMYLADLIRANTDIDAVHEHLFYGCYEKDTPGPEIMHEYNTHGNSAKVKAFWKKKLDGLPSDYVETSHLSAKAGLVENAPKGSKFVILERDMGAVVKSMKDRGDYMNVGNVWMWYLAPDYAMNRTEYKKQTDVFEWYYKEVQARAEHFEKEFPEHEYLRITVDELNEEKGVKKLLKFMGIKPKGDIVIPPKSNENHPTIKQQSSNSNLPKIMLAIPHIGTLIEPLVQWMWQHNQRQTFSRIMLSNERPTDYNRNVIVEEFLKTDNEYLMMVDSDIAPPLNAPDMALNKLPICAAFAQMNNKGDVQPVGMMKSEKDGHTMFAVPQFMFPDKLMEEKAYAVDAVGTGCIMIRRDVLENMEPPWFSFEHDPKTKKLTRGEDFYFCLKSGVKVYMDTRFKCKHFTEVAI